MSYPPIFIIHLEGGSNTSSEKSILKDMEIKRGKGLQEMPKKGFVSLLRVSIIRLLILLLLLILLSCYGGAGNGGSLMIYDFTVYHDEQNALRIIAEWKTLQPADSKIEYREFMDSGNWMSTPINNLKVTDHKVIIVGLHPETHYVFRPVSDNITGDEVTISTKEMPELLPQTQLVVNMSGTSSNDLTIGGFPSPISTIVAVNGEGRIVWYHEDSNNGDPGDFSVIDEDGRLIYNLFKIIKAVDFMGNEEVLLNVQSFGEVCHHDFLITPQGNYMYLSRSMVVVNDREWCVDEIVERDKDGGEVWRWRSREHADKLGGFVEGNVWQEEYIDGCGYDWTHCNSIDLKKDREGKQFIILSVRNLNRVIKIDYHSGEIIWQLGDDLDFEFIGSEPEELQWFRCQHSASYLPDISSILLFDNGNERYEIDTDDFSRAVIYKIDEENMTAEITWKYDIQSFAGHAGAVQRLSNGNILITLPTDRSMMRSAFIEVDESEERLWQVEFIYPQSLANNFLLGNMRISSLYDLYKK